MDFGWAINALKAGLRVKRSHWTKGFLWLKPTTRVQPDWCHDPVLKQLAEQQEGGIPASATISSCFKDSNDAWVVVTGWAPQQYDLFAEDWQEWQVEEQDGIDKLPKAGGIENCEILSNAINQLLESIGVMPHLTVTLVPGPEDKELLISIEERSDHGASNFPLYVADVDGIIKTNIGSPVKSTRPVAGVYEVEDMQSNLGKED